MILLMRLLLTSTACVAPQVSLYWLKHVRDLTPAVTKLLLGVRHMWIAQYVSWLTVIACIASQVSLYWLKRVRDLTPAVTKLLLGVRHVWIAQYVS